MLFRAMHCFSTTILTPRDFGRVKFYATDTDPWLDLFSQFWAKHVSPFSLWAVGAALFFVLW